MTINYISPSSLSSLSLVRSGAAGAVTLPSHLFPWGPNKTTLKHLQYVPWVHWHSHQNLSCPPAASPRCQPQIEFSHWGRSVSLSASALVHMGNKAPKVSSMKVWLRFMPHQHTHQLNTSLQSPLPLNTAFRPAPTASLASAHLRSHAEKHLHHDREH